MRDHHGNVLEIVGSLIRRDDYFTYGHLYTAPGPVYPVETSRDGHTIIASAWPTAGPYLKESDKRTHEIAKRINSALNKHEDVEFLNRIWSPEPDAKLYPGWS